MDGRGMEQRTIGIDLDDRRARGVGSEHGAHATTYSAPRQDMDTTRSRPVIDPQAPPRAVGRPGPTARGGAWVAQGSGLEWDDLRSRALPSLNHAHRPRARDPGVATTYRHDTDAVVSRHCYFQEHAQTTYPRAYIHARTRATGGAVNTKYVGNCVASGTFLRLFIAFVGVDTNKER